MNVDDFLNEISVNNEPKVEPKPQLEDLIINKFKEKQTNYLSLSVDTENLTLSQMKNDFSCIQEQLAPYILNAINQHKVSSENAGHKLSELSEGFLEVSHLIALASNRLYALEIERKRIEGFVSIEEFDIWCSQTNKKGTEELRKQFTNQHHLVLDIRMKEALAQSMKVELESYKTCIFMAISSIKAIAFASRNSDVVCGTVGFIT